MHLWQNLVFKWFKSCYCPLHSSVNCFTYLWLNVFMLYTSLVWNHSSASFQLHAVAVTVGQSASFASQGSIDQGVAWITVHFTGFCISLILLLVDRSSFVLADWRLRPWGFSSRVWLCWAVPDGCALVSWIEGSRAWLLEELCLSLLPV